MYGQETAMKLLHTVGIKASDAAGIMRHPVRGARLAQGLYLAWKNDIHRDMSEPFASGHKGAPHPILRIKYGYAIDPELVYSLQRDYSYFADESEFKLPKHGCEIRSWPGTKNEFGPWYVLGSSFIVKRDTDGLCREAIKLARFNRIKNSKLFISRKLLEEMYTEAARAALTDLDAHYKKYLSQVLYNLTILKLTRERLEKTGYLGEVNTRKIYLGFGTETVGGLCGEINWKGEVKVTGVHTLLDCGVPLDDFERRLCGHANIDWAIEANPKYFGRRDLIGMYHSHSVPFCPGRAYRDHIAVMNDKRLFNVDAVLDIGFLSSRFPELVRDEVMKEFKLKDVEAIAGALAIEEKRQRIEQHLITRRSLFLKQLKTYFKKKLPSVAGDCVEFAISNRHLFSSSKSKQGGPAGGYDMTRPEILEKSVVHGIVKTVKIV